MQRKEAMPGCICARNEQYFKCIGWIVGKKSLLKLYHTKYKVANRIRRPIYELNWRMLMSGNEIMKIIESNLPIVKTEVNAVIGGIFIAIFLRKNTATSEFEKLKQENLKRY